MKCFLCDTNLDVLAGVGYCKTCYVTITKSGNFQYTVTLNNVRYEILQNGCYIGKPYIKIYYPGSSARFALKADIPTSKEGAENLAKRLVSLINFG